MITDRRNRDAQSDAVEWLASGIETGRPWLDPQSGHDGYGGNALGEGTFSSLVQVCLSWDHEYMYCRRK